MDDKMKKMKRFDGEDVDVLGETYQDGFPEGDLYADRWRKKFTSRDKMLKFITTGQRYWYDKEESFGSEKRKTRA